MTNNNEAHLSMGGADYRFQSGADVFGASADGVCGTETIHRQQRDDGGNGAFLCRLVGNK